MTHPRLHADTHSDRLAVVMSDRSGSLSYGELERRANQGAHLLRTLGIQRGETIAFWLPNDPVVFEVYWAGKRSGLHITPIATALTGAEAAHIFENSGSRLVVVSPDVAGLADLPVLPGVQVMTVAEWRAACAQQATPKAG